MTRFVPAVLLFCCFLSPLLTLGAKLRNFQLAQPPVLPKNAKQCTVKVLERNFAFSYYIPEIVQLNPPTDCGEPGSWAAVTLNLTVTSNGTQYDRLGVFTFQNVEFWRTSTPEPTRGEGIIWTYLKDVTPYIPLFAKPGTFILQLDNIVQPGLDGEYATVLHATYYASSKSNPPAKKSDLIVPISTLRNDTGNAASVPPGLSLNVTLPRNTVEVYAELFASGNGQEEFWNGNVPTQYLDNLPKDTTYGQGPFREVRLLVDGRVAGVAFPYVTIFTGGFSPSLWRPISAYGALDLPTYFLDLTPFVPILADGNPHNITIDVASAEEDRTILQNWYVSGLLQVFTDHKSTKPTIGKIISYTAEPYAKASSVGNVLDTGDLEVVVKAKRHLRIESLVISGSGQANRVVFTQDFTFSNQQNYISNATYQIIDQVANGEVLSQHNGKPVLRDSFSYPFWSNLTFLKPDWSSWEVHLDHKYDRTLHPAPFLLGTTTHNIQQAFGNYMRAPTGNYGNGTSNNTFSYVDLQGNTYTRKVNAAYTKITLDKEGGSLAPYPVSAQPEEPLVGVQSYFNDAGVARLPGGK